jgi:hypothetical protein
MPTRSPKPCKVSVSPRLTRKTVSLLTVAGSMSPVNGTVIRGCVEKPSSPLMTSMSWQSLTRTAQSGLGSWTRRSVFWVPSNTV